MKSSDAEPNDTREQYNLAYGHCIRHYKNAFTGVVEAELKKGEKIQLVGFGTFEVAERAARMGKNPQTGEEVSIPACKAPKFKIMGGNSRLLVSEMKALYR